MDDLEYKKKILDTKSASFCGAKWYNATIWLGSGMTTSCHHPLPHKIDPIAVQSNPKLLHNTPEKKEQRRQMQCGERPAGCEYCWKIEDIGRDAISDRVYKSKIFSNQDLDTAYGLDHNADVDLKTLEIAFDRTCNFACTYCNPAFSSTWANNIKQKGPYTDLHRSLDELRITGGEPMMSPNLWRLLDWIETQGDKMNSNMTIAINSNLGAKQSIIDRFKDKLKKFKRFELYTSCEATFAQAEYIRDGLDYSAWHSNILHMMVDKVPRAIHNMATINALCLESLPQFLEKIIWFKNAGKVYGPSINYTLNILRFPSFQSPLVLPDDLRNKFKGDLVKFLTNNSKWLENMEIDHTQRLIDYLDVVKTPHAGAAEQSKLQKDFKTFYSQYDKRTGKDFEKTFPIIGEWYRGI
jgi:organic radical activating enzyme